MKASVALKPHKRLHVAEMNSPVRTTSSEGSPKPLQGVWDARARRPCRGRAGGRQRAHTPARLRCPRPAAPRRAAVRPSPGPRPRPRPPAPAAHRVRLQTLARLDGRCQRHRVVQQHLASRRLLHEGHPGPPPPLPLKPGQEPEAPSPATRRVPPPLLSTRTAPRPARRRRPRVLAPVVSACRLSTPVCRTPLGPSAVLHGRVGDCYRRPMVAVRGIMSLALLAPPRPRSVHSVP